ncbi:hypothetical protein FACS1894214_5060 [Planctomycetales bacterium]|nr:hypothetical protein FACS1894214_5060 [Planctomycetales bacterium]
MSIASQVAKAVVAELKMHEFSLSFEPVFSVLPSYEPAELQTLRVSVVPRTLEIESATRHSSKYTVGIDIGIQRRIEGTPEETVESLGNLVDEISLFLKENSLNDFPTAQWSGVSNDPLYVPEHLSQKRSFTSVLTVKYLLFD